MFPNLYSGALHLWFYGFNCFYKDYRGSVPLICKYLYIIVLGAEYRYYL